MTTLLDAATRLYNAGWAVVPVRADGSKSPAIAWKQYQSTRPDWTQVEQWVTAPGVPGVGVITGAVSGNLEMLEFEKRAVTRGLLQEISNLAGDNGLSELWARISTGYVERSPSGGVHFHYHVAGPVRGNTVLARDPDAQVLVETRGEGGFTITAPTAGGAHPTGHAWQIVRGVPADAPTLTLDEYDSLHLLMGLLDEDNGHDTPPFVQPGHNPYPRAAEPHSGDDRPGDDYNQRHTWEEILTARGWTRVRQIGDETCWRRPGKPHGSGISATTGRGGYDNLYNFSSNADLPVGVPVSKFMAYAIWHHAGDLKTAAKALAADGYGRRHLEVVTGGTAATPAEHPTAGPGPSEGAVRRLVVTPASEIKPRPVKWLWNQRMPLGALTLLGGREGIGKSTIAYSVAADITRGDLPGRCQGEPRTVIVVATEDSWEHTIVPRLMAHNADLSRVLRVRAATADGLLTGLVLPADNAELERLVTERQAALILLDPLMSRLHTSLDSHKDAEVRVALEPLVDLADRTDASILGLIHVNKGGSTDPLGALMGSRAFAAVARAVLFVMVDPDDETQRLLGQAKNNLGPLDLPTLAFGIESATVAESDEGPIVTGRIQWRGEFERSIHDAMNAARESEESREATREAGEFIVEYLRSAGGTADSAAVKRAAVAVGMKEGAVNRARSRRKIIVQSGGFPRRTYWRLPTTTPTPLTSLEVTGMTGTTDMTGQDGTKGEGDLSSRAVVQSFGPPRARETTAVEVEGLALDWRSHRSGPPAPCRLCGQPTTTRDDHGQPCHKTCAETDAVHPA